MRVRVELKFKEALIGARGGSRVCRECMGTGREVGIIVRTSKKGLDFLQKCLDGGGILVA